MAEQAEGVVTLGDFIRSRMKELGLTQLVMSRKFGISGVSRILTGKTPKPTDKLLAKLSEALQVNLDDLVALRPKKMGPPNAKEIRKVLASYPVWAICVVLERVEGKPIEDILMERLRETLSSQSES